MVRKLLAIFHKRKLAAGGCIVALVIGAAALATVAMPTPVRADACDKVNIVYCGLDGTDASGYINSFQAVYQRGTNNGYNDLKAVYRWSGAPDSKVSNMNTTNTKVGTLYRNGDVKVDGVLVGHDAWVAARFGAGRAGFVQVTDNAWARKTTTSLEHDTYKIIVHYGTDGNADFAVMVICGNAIKFTPTPQPKPQLVCVDLTALPVNNSRSARFVARASAKNTTITKYVFDFGDGTKATIPTSTTQATVIHAYDAFSTNFTARVTVYGADFPNGVTSSACTAQFKTPPKGNLVCTSLTAVDTAQPLTKNLVATASAVTTKITSYTYTITGDGTTVTKVVTTSAANASLPYTFAKDSTTYTVSVVVRGTSNEGVGVTSPACTLSVTTPGPKECKPGVPVGDARCNECKPGIPVGDERCSPQVLADTGPGSVVGIAGAAGFAGVIGRYFYLRRKLGM